MIEHHIQKAIIYRLALNPSLRFSELKPDNLDNKLFDYHLKLVMSGGYVAKKETGEYYLTSPGKLLGIHVKEQQSKVLERARSVLFLVVRRPSDHAWLLYRRKSHPLLNKTGFMHANPVAYESITETAKNICLKNTGITCDFTTQGGGYFHVYQNGVLESFTHFTLLHCESSEGELIQNDPHAEYYWEQDPDFADEKMLPNMRILVEKYLTKQPFHLDEKLELSAP